MEETLINNRYELLDIIGEGGMGLVYRAGDRLTGDIVALKQISLKSSNESLTSLKIRVANEFRIMARLNHPYILSVYDYGFIDEHPFFTMPLLEDPRTIFEYTKDKDTETCMRLCLEILQALQYLHRQEIVHRDLKPANVLVDKHGHVQLLDFGLAIYADTLRVTPMNSLAGTVFYMSPEMFQGESPSTASDLFTAGIIIYELLARQHPFADKGVFETMNKLLYLDPDWSLIEDRVPEIIPVLERLLHKDPEGRYESAFDAAQAIAEACNITIDMEDINILESFLKASQFVGRDEEMAGLMTAFEDAKNGNGGLLLIGGESGIGKSRLVDEFRVSALVGEATVIRSYATDGGGLPLNLWRDILRHLALSQNLTESEASVFKTLIPDIERIVNMPIPDVPVLNGEDTRQRLASVISDVLRKQPNPIVIILEDVHWAVDSLDILQRVSKTIDAIPALILATYRTDEDADLPAFLPDTPVTMLDLLSKDEIKTLCVSMLGETGKNEALTELLYRESEGNTYFIVEVIRALAEHAGGLESINHENLPEQIVAGGIQEIIHHRLERFPARFWGLLRLLAIAGRAIDEEIIQYFADQYGVNLQLWRSHAASAFIIEKRGDSWQFSHDKIRQHILAQIPSEQIKSFHQQVAEAIEFVHMGNLDYATILADHWHIAENDFKEQYYAATAAGQYMAIANYKAAREMFERMLALIPPEETLQRAQILVTLGTISSRISEFEDADGYAGQALDLAESHGHQNVLVQAYLIQASVAEYRSDFPTATKILRQANELVSTVTLNKSLQVQTLNSLGMMLAHMEKFDEATTHLKEARTLAEQLNDRVLTAEIALAEVILYRKQGDYFEAEMHCYDALLVFESVGNFSQIAQIRNEMGSLAFYGKRPEIALAHLELALRHYQDLGDRWGIADSLSKLGEIYIQLGQTDVARDYIDRSMEIATDLNISSLILNAMLAQARLMMLEGSEERDDGAGQLDKYGVGRSTQHIIEKLLMQMHGHVSTQVYDTIFLDEGDLDIDEIADIIKRDSESFEEE